MPEFCEGALALPDVPPQVAEGRREAYAIIGKLLTEPVCTAVARVVEDVERNPEAARRHAWSIPIDTISNATAHIPPDVTDACGDTLPQLPKPGTPDKTLQAELTKWGDAYWPHHVTHARETPGMHANVEPNRQQLMQGLYLWIKGGGSVDPESWSVNQAAYARQLSRGYETLCQAAVVMCADYGNPFNKKFRGFDYLTEKYDASLVATTGIANVVLAQVRAPIGHYGEQNTADSLRATVLMMHYLWQDQRLWSDIEQRLHNSDHPAYDPRTYDVVRHHTLRANAKMRWGSLEASVVAGIVEGALSVHAVRHLRTAKADPTYPDQSDYYNLITAMAERGSANATTMRASLSLAGLSERQGRYMPGLTGTITTPEAKKTLAKIR